MFLPGSDGEKAERVDVSGKAGLHWDCFDSLTDIVGNQIV